MRSNYFRPSSIPPALTLAPLPPRPDAPRRAPWREFDRRFEAYKAPPTPHGAGILNYLIRNKGKILIDERNDFTPGKVLA